MEESGQLHVTAAFSQGKELPIPVGYETGWTPDRSGCLSDEINRDADVVLCMVAYITGQYFSSTLITDVC